MGKGFNPNQGPPLGPVPDLSGMGGYGGGPSAEDIERLIQQQQESMDISLRMGIVTMLCQHQAVTEESTDKVLEAARDIEAYVRNG